MSCPKCESDEVLTKFVSDGDLINSSSYKRLENEFVTSIEYDFFYKLKAVKDHLKKHCGNCNYQWRIATADNR